MPRHPQPVPSDPAAELTRKPLGFASTQASVLLDCVRGIAAVLVLAGHWRNLFFADYPSLIAHKTLFAIPYLLTSAGHQSVIIFFVLSGYLISGSVFRMFARNAWSWRDYLLHRIVRLWIVLIPGLLLGALWDAIGLHLERPTALLIYRGGYGLVEIGDIRPAFHVWVWLANLFFLQGRGIPVFGSNGPLWSLANEFWYYILFPLALLALRRDTRTGLRVVCAVLFLVIAWRIDVAILLLFPVWLLGTLLVRLPAPGLGVSARIAATIVYLPILFAGTKLHTQHTVLADWIFGLITFGYLWVLLSARSQSDEAAPATRATRVLARFSYTLYVAHVPLIVLVAALLLGPARWQPDAAHIALACVILALTVVYSYGLATVTEFRTDKVRKWLERRLPGHS